MMIEDQTGSHLYYVATDFLGSICGLMDANGNMVEEYSFDPWGNRRNPNDWAQADLRVSFITDRGYTGHEHLDQFGLINMNGRVYDPAVGRFLSPDPIVQTEGGSQSMNAYSYALNNPLKYTDPTGYRTTSPYVNMSVEGANQNSAHWQQTADYYNSMYGDHTFWGGGAYLTRIQNFGGGLGKVQDGLFAELVTSFIPGNLIDNITPSIRNGERGTWIKFGYSYLSAANGNTASNLFFKQWETGDPTTYASSRRTYAVGLFWFNMEPIFETFKVLRDFENPILGPRDAWENFKNPSPSNPLGVPHYFSIGAGFLGIAGVGAGTSFEFTWVIRGPEASWKPMLTTTESVGAGMNIDATLNINLGYYFGTGDFRRRYVQTSSPEGDFPTLWGSGAFAADGKIGLTGNITINPRRNDVIFSPEINIGAGLVPVANWGTGASNTYILKDWY